MPGRIALVILVLAAITALFIWFDKHSVLPQANAKHNYSWPEYTVQQFSLYNTREDGQLHYITSGMNYIKWVNNPVSQIDHVEMDYFAKDRQLWQIKADKAYWNEIDASMLLNGNATIHEKAGEHSPAINISSPSLLIWTEQDIIETSSDVLFEQGSQILAGSGLHADFERGIFTLHAHVRGHYEP